MDKSYFSTARAYGLKAVNSITKRLYKVVTLSGEFLKCVVEIFVERAKEKLINSGYGNMEHYAQNIVVTKYKNNNYRVGIKENEEKPIMYFLEFGTGIVGKDGVDDFYGLKKHAESVGWQYAVYEHAYVYSNKLDAKGWVFFDEKRGTFRFTSGLYPVAYLYLTSKEMYKIFEEAKRRVLKRGK